jgi:aminoglycoside phosphotransferase (APT) family kinase protein
MSGHDAPAEPAAPPPPGYQGRHRVPDAPPDTEAPTDVAPDPPSDGPPPPDGRGMAAAAAVRDRLRDMVGPALGQDAADLTIQNLRELRRTLRRVTWAFDAVTRHGSYALILQAPRGEAKGHFARQARVQAVGAACGVPTPRVLASDDTGDALGHPFLLSELVKGEAEYRDIVRRLDSADPNGGRARLLQQCAFALAAIHRIDAHSPERELPRQLELCRAKLDALGPATGATFEWAFRWLSARQPPPSTPVLVHGDYRIGNLLADGADLTGVLGWEFVHFGAACEDLAWFCVRAGRFGAPAALGAGGLGSIESFLHAYEDASGTVVDRADFRWWQVRATLLWGLRLRGQSQQWLTQQQQSGGARVPAMRLARVGRHVCEAEWDLLDLLDDRQADHADALGPAPAPARVISEGWKDLLG